MNIKNLLIIGIIILLLGCAKEVQEKKEETKVVFEEPEQPPEPKEEIVYVKIHKFSFEPDVINITTGTTVIWENVDDYNHYIFTPGSGFQSPKLKPGETFKLNFYEARTYKYVEPNFGVIGYVNVE